MVLPMSPPGAMRGTSGRSARSNRTSAPSRPAPPSGQRKPGCSPQAYGAGSAPGLATSIAIVERVGAQPVFDRERKGEGIDRTRALVVAEGEPGEVRRCGLDGEGLEPREAVERERVSPAVDPLLPVARPADHRIEDRTDLAPDRRIARPHQLSPADPPLSRLGAERARSSPARRRGSARPRSWGDALEGRGGDQGVLDPGR